MENDQYTRRNFLKTFAMLSSAPLLANLLPGCGSSSTNGNWVMYGPGPVPTVSVTGMYFLDAQSTPVSLSGSQNVPVHTSFIIQFSTAMDMTSVESAISFVDAGNVPVAFAASPVNDSSTQLTPATDLTNNSDYTLSVNAAARSSGGDALTVDATASASFRTDA